jgi:drug/metabolite transporter (DMT)-like permease
MKNAYLRYLTALLLFGSNGIVASHISLGSCQIVLLRTLIGSALLVVLYLTGRPRANFANNKRHLFFLVLSGIAMGASWMFLYEAYRRIGVSIASLAYYCGPVIVMALSPLLFGERLTVRKLCGFASVLCGIFFIDAKTAWHAGVDFGLLCGVMSAVMYAAMVIFNKKAKSITGIENAALQLFVSFLTTAIFVGFTFNFDINIQHGDWPYILLLGIANTGLGCYLYFSSIANIPVQAVAVCGYLEPLSAVVLSAVFLKETMTPMQIAGAVLIIGGAVFAEMRRFKNAPCNFS